MLPDQQTHPPHQKYPSIKHDLTQTKKKKSYELTTNNKHNWDTREEKEFDFRAKK